MTETPRLFKGETAEQRRSDRRARLREACLDLVGDFGLAGVSVNAVCAQAGLTKRYFYESYADRDALLLELLDDFFATLGEGIVAVLADAPADVEARSRATAEILLGSLDRDRRLARLYVESPGEPVLHERRDRAVDEFALLLAEHVVELDAADPEVRFALNVVTAGTTDVVSRWLAGGTGWTHRQLADAITRLGVTVARL